MVLSPEQVLSLAAPFISGGCDPAAALGLTRGLLLTRLPSYPPGELTAVIATPALTVTNTEPVAPGDLLTFGGVGVAGKDTAVRNLPSFRADLARRPGS